MSEGVEWAMHCAVILGGLEPGAVLAGKTLAEMHGVSESYLLKHLKALVQGRVLESVPGPRGGYRLARAASEITMLDVVQAIEGTEPAFRCTEIRAQGPCAAPPEACARKACAIKIAMLRAEKAWRDSLRGQAISDIANSLVHDIEPPRFAAMGEWLAERVR